MKNLKLHALVIALIVIAEMIGIIPITLGVGKIVLLPLLYALLMGILLTPKFTNIVNDKDMLDANSLVGLTMMLLMARY
mgnify:FL=1